MITQTYILNLVPDKVPVIVNCSQYDSLSRTIEMTIYDGSALYSIPNGTTASVRGTKEDNTGFEYPCTISGSKVSFDIQDQMTLYAGKVPCEIRLADSNGIIGTCNFILNVEETTLDPDITISESDLPLLETAEQNAIRAENAADRAETLLDTKQDVLTAGTGIQLNGATISNNFSNLSGVDLDAITYQCIAYVNDSSTNKPTTYGGILISKCNETSLSYGVQIFITYANTGKGAYYRNRVNGVWYGWNPLYLTAGNGIEISATGEIKNVFPVITSGSLNDIDYNYQGYASSGTTDRPVTSGGSLCCIMHPTSQYGFQLFSPIGTTDSLYFRNLNNGTWRAWRKVTTTAV